MSELINAIKSLNSRDWFDYFSAFLPLVLSIVAIIIAIDTSKRQNKATLFEKRYSNYSELLGFCTLWKMFIDQFNRLQKTNGPISINSIYKLCLSISLLMTDEVKDIDFFDFVKDNDLDREKIKSELFSLRYKNSLTLEFTSLLHGGRMKKIEFFSKQYVIFHDRIEKVLNKQITIEEFNTEVKTYQDHLSTFYKLIFTYIKPKVKLID